MLSCDFLDHSVHPDVQFGHQDVKVLYCEKGLYNFDSVQVDSGQVESGQVKSSQDMSS